MIKNELKNIQIKPYLVSVWRGFLNWRKKNMSFRLTILLLIFTSLAIERLAMPNYARPINALVGIACQAIRNGSEPRVAYRYLHYLEAQENIKLQRQLNGSMNMLTPVEIREINRVPSRADFNILFEAAQRIGIIPALPDLRQTKNEMLAWSLKLTHEEFGVQWDALDYELFNTPSPKSWEFWRNGTMWFLQSIAFVLPTPLLKGGALLMLCLVLGFILAHPGDKISYLAILLPVIITFVWVCPAEISMSYYHGFDYMIPRCFYYCLLAVVAGILGSRLKRRALCSPYCAEITAAVIGGGGIILANGYLFNPSMRFYFFEMVNASIYNTWFIPPFQAAGVFLIVYASVIMGRKYRDTHPSACLRFVLMINVAVILLIVVAWWQHPIMSNYSFYYWLGFTAMIVGLQTGAALVYWSVPGRVRTVNFCFSVIILMLYFFFSIAMVISPANNWVNEQLETTDINIFGRFLWG